MIPARHQSATEKEKEDSAQRSLPREGSGRAHPLQHLLPGGHGGDGTPLFHAQGGNGVPKAGETLKIGQREGREGLAALADAGEKSAPEGIPGTGGVHGTGGETGNHHGAFRGGQQGALAGNGHCDTADSPCHQLPGAFQKIICAGEQGNFIIGHLQKVH